MLTIHNFARGARGLRLMWQCEEMGLPYRVQIVSYPPSAEYRALNPLGTVPYLDDDGVGLNESAAIMLYLAHKYGPTDLLPDGENPLSARVLQLVVMSEATLGSGLNTLMAAHFGAPPESKRNWSVGVAEGRVEQTLGYLEALLGAGPYFAGERFTLADIAIVTGLGMWKGALGKSFTDRISSYREAAIRRPAYQRASKQLADASNAG